MIKVIVQFMKFSFVGGLNTLISLGIYYLLVYFGVNYMISNIIGYFTSSVTSYLLNKIWVFQAKKGETISTALRYYIVYGSSFIINIGSMYLWVDILHLSKYEAPILTMCITVPFNFLLNKFWTFK